MSWTDPFVRAGVACPAFVKEKTGVYPSVFFRYRRPDPVTIESQHKEFSSLASDPKKLIESMQGFVARWIESWSFDAPCDKAHVLMLGHSLLMRFYFIIVETDPTAEIPKEFLSQGEAGSAEGEQKK